MMTQALTKCDCGYPQDQHRRKHLLSLSEPNVLIKNHMIYFRTVIISFFFFFFFQAEDGIRDVIVTGVQTCALPICNRQGARAFTTTVPTPEMYNGDYSNWVDKNGKQIPIYDPTTQVTNADGTVTRKPFPNNQIPKALFDPLAVKALGVFQASGVLTPNTGAAPGTVGYVTNNYVVTKGSNVSPINK